MALWRTLRFICGHPLNRGRKVAALRDWLCWQVGARLVPGPVAIPWVGQARLWVEPGMTGATGNLYVGLAELEEMAFTLHLLREDDLFVDVGANIGAYTILASKVAAARTIAFEPLPAAYRKLVTNVQLNAIADRVEAINAAAGAEAGHLSCTDTLDTMNHVVPDSVQSAQGCR